MPLVVAMETPTVRGSLNLEVGSNGKKKTQQDAISPAEIERAIHLFRGQRVILDSDLARLYGVTTARLNEQVSRNLDRFPEDFAFQLAVKQKFTHREVRRLAITALASERPR